LGSTFNFAGKIAGKLALGAKSRRRGERNRALFKLPFESSASGLSRESRNPKKKERRKTEFAVLNSGISSLKSSKLETPKAQKEERKKEGKGVSVCTLFGGQWALTRERSYRKRERKKKKRGGGGKKKRFLRRTATIVQFNYQQGGTEEEKKGEGGGGKRRFCAVWGLHLKILSEEMCRLKKKKRGGRRK